jgi:hypothetical protein
MNNRIDQLFKDKLGEHTLPPSVNGWASVQAGLSKKNKVVIYWRAAAVVALMGLLISAWYLLNTPVETSPAELTNTVMPEQIKPISPVDKDNAAIKSLAVIKKEEAEVKESEKIRTKKEQILENTTSKEEVVESVTEVHTISESLPDNETVLIAQHSNIEKPIVIEFSLPSIEDTNSTAADLAVTETEKPSGIKKFLATARDLKNGEAEFGGSLRGLKDELLALDFKKDKTKRN